MGWTTLPLSGGSPPPILSSVSSENVRVWWVKVVPLLDMLSSRLSLRERIEETLGIERVLAVARMMLSASSLVALHLNPAEPFPWPSLVFVLLVVHWASSLARLASLWRWPEV